MLFLKTTHTTVAPGVFQVDLAAKPPGKTFAIIAALDADDMPQSFVDAIKGMGFKEMQSSTYMHGDGKKVFDVVYQKPGTDIFEGWTVAEKEANLKQIESVLGSFSITVTPRVMSLAEAYQ
jgi:hypothetical protein